MESKREELESGFSYIILNGKYMVSGQPDSEDFPLLKQIGPVRVINLRNEEELNSIDFNESLVAEDLSIPYDNIPIIQNGDFHIPSLKKIESLLSGLSKGEKALIHCAAGQRASVALIFFLIQTGQTSKTSAEALATDLGLKNIKLLNRLLEII